MSVSLSLSMEEWPLLYYIPWHQITCPMSGVKVQPVQARRSRRHAQVGYG